MCVWDWAVGAVAERRQSVSRSLHEGVFAWMTLADDRNLVATYVAGRELRSRAAVAAAVSV